MTRTRPTRDLPIFNHLFYIPVFNQIGGKRLACALMRAFPLPMAQRHSPPTEGRSKESKNVRRCRRGGRSLPRSRPSGTTATTSSPPPPTPRASASGPAAGHQCAARPMESGPVRIGAFSASLSASTFTRLPPRARSEGLGSARGPGIAEARRRRRIPKGNTPPPPRSELLALRASLPFSGSRQSPGDRVRRQH